MFQNLLADFWHISERFDVGEGKDTNLESKVHKTLFTCGKVLTLCRKVP